MWNSGSGQRWLTTVAGVLALGLAVLAALFLVRRPDSASATPGIITANPIFDQPTPVSAVATPVALETAATLIVHPEAGKPAPDFTLLTLDGNEVSLSDFRGQPVLINFWASWCLPCRQEMPELVQAYETHQVEGFVILGINLTFQDSIADAEAFVEEFDMTFPILLDQDGEVANEYQLLGLPMSIFVDKDGVVSHIHIGMMTGEQTDEYTAEILN